VGFDEGGDPVIQLAINPLVQNSNAVIDVIAAQLRTAQADGDMPAGLDPDLEAISLMTMSAGLGTSVLAGHSTPEQAQAVIDYHLDRVFPKRHSSAAEFLASYERRPAHEPPPRRSP
jgi:hypothetical protein